MPLLRLDQVDLHYGTQVILDHVDFTMHKGTRLGLLGRNGAGKTTLLKVLAGDITPDSGERWIRPGTRLAWLQQSLPDGDEQTVYDVVASGLAEAGELLSQYHHLLQETEPAADLDELARVQQQLEECVLRRQLQDLSLNCHYRNRTVFGSRGGRCDPLRSRTEV